ncbi:MAG: bifunctional UDP-N-acetylmuramoyl-tripeptide:D-alanyl-D-alanine ligase/alanine racemase [Flavobacterium sp.]
MKLGFENIVTLLSGTYYGPGTTAVIDHVSIDSRSSQNHEGTLFFALLGPNHDAHFYLDELHCKGVRHFVVSKLPLKLNDNTHYLLVDNTLAAFQQLAVYHRSQFDIPVMAITGSNGKTIVKEWLNFLLSPDYNIIRSPKSYNSQVGVPLSVLGINEGHNLAIFEAGISTTHEMSHLESIIQPSIGILTNIGSAHDEGFQNMAEKIKEKTKLFRNVALLIYNKNKTVEAFLPNGLNTFSWSSNDSAADVMVHAKTIGQETHLNVTYQGVCSKLKIPFADEASIENVIHCLMVMLHFGYDLEIIQKRLVLLYPIEMRLKVKNGKNRTTLIDDSYSSDFQSLKIALDFLENQSQHHKKTLILSDIFQSGLEDEELYARISQLVIAHKISRVIGVGKVISKFKHKFPNAVVFESTEALISDIRTVVFENETILVKGARHFHFEQLITFLEEKKHETVLEINLNALTHNFNFYRGKLTTGTKLMVMVKAFGYGNGGVELAKLLEYFKVDYLGVAFADEGILLRENGIKTPIMVLNPESTSYSEMIDHDLEPEIYSFNGLQAFRKMIREKKKSSYPVHLKLDTGMHRLGFDTKDVEILASHLKESKEIEIKSILSHLAASESAEHHDFTKHQIALFEKYTSYLCDTLHIQPILHILNSSGITRFPEAQLDMVRLGIGLYGISNDPKEQLELEQVGTMFSVISQIRTIPEGDSVGYGRRFIALKETKIATIPVGYADGIRRAWGNGVGYVTINDQKAPVVGSVCMDMLMVDVSEVVCYEGQRVTIFGASPSISEMAHKLQTIPYEVLTSISQRVKRIFFRD